MFGRDLKLRVQRGNHFFHDFKKFSVFDVQVLWANFGEELAQLPSSASRLNVLLWYPIHVPLRILCTIIRDY